MNLIEQVRGDVVRSALSGSSFARDWPLRRRAIQEHLGPAGSVSREDVVGIGSVLSDLFVNQTRNLAHERDQSSVSGGGVVWDSLVNYYLNMCFAGTDALAVRERQVPQAMQRACRVAYRSAAIDASPDHMVLILPGARSLGPASTPAEAVASFAGVVAERFDELTAIVLTCKTNWNDNIQTPMLWSLLYRLRASGAQPPVDVSIGQPPFTLERLVDFDFAFVTVPSNRVEAFHARSMPVLRGETMSGGVFWGRPTRPSVARSLAEFFAYQGELREFFPPADQAGETFALAVRHPTNAVVDLRAFDLY